MYKIAFFCIPAYGHTNPTIEVVRQLTQRGNEVWYFSYNLFREKIESAGARFIACDAYDVQMDLSPSQATRVGKDMAFSIKLLTNTTLALDEMVCSALQELGPDCVIADSMAVWGKFAALKLQIPFLSSTTTFAFNRYSAKIMKQSLFQMFAMFKGMPQVNREIKRLQSSGYPVKNLLSIMQNDNDTHTIVYTSKEFQPCSDTFSDKYTFVGPSVPASQCNREDHDFKQVYISMGTVNNNMPDLYRNCIRAFRDSGYRIVMSVGEETEIEKLGDIPDNFSVQHQVQQIDVLQNSDVFLSHGGMNSVNESLYCQVPLVLFPQTAEQGGVANRVVELHAGVKLKNNRADTIRSAVDAVLTDTSYRANAVRISQSFQQAGGASAAANAILKFMEDKK